MPDTAGPHASVIIPAYNAASTIGEQLAALSRQDTGLTFEVLVCDNGSTDETATVVDAWRDRMPYLRLIDASHRRGAAAARNAGARAASSTVLLFCDADDVVDHGWVGALTAATADSGFAAGLMEHALLNPRAAWDGGWVEPTYREGFLPWLPAAGSGNMGVRADVFARVGGFDETRPSGEDADLSWRLQLAGQPVTPIVSAVVHVRKREGAVATFRQGLAKGRAVRQLRHDYQRVAAAFAAAQATLPQDRRGDDARDQPVRGLSGLSPTARPLGTGRWRRAPRRALRVLRRPHELLREWGQLASAIGYRFGRIDSTRPLIEPGNLVGPLVADADRGRRGPRLF